MIINTYYCLIYLLLFPLPSKNWSLAVIFTFIFSHFSHDILLLSLSRWNGNHGKAFAHRCSHNCSIQAVLDCCAHQTIFSLSISCASAFDADTSTLHKTCSYLVVFSRKSKAESRILWHSWINKERHSPPQVQQPSQTHPLASHPAWHTRRFQYLSAFLAFPGASTILQPTLPVCKRKTLLYVGVLKKTGCPTSETYQAGLAMSQYQQRVPVTTITIV